MDIEREVELGGPIHSKGALILSGFLVARPLVSHAVLGARPVRFPDFWRRRIARIWPAYIAALTPSEPVTRQRTV